jgi:hypothetical protein
MLSLDQLDRLYKTNREVFDKAKDKYPIQALAYSLANNLNIEGIKFDLGDTDSCSEVVNMLAHEEGVTIPESLLKKVGKVYPGEFTNYVIDSIVDHLPLANNIISYIVSDYEVCKEVAMEREDFIPYLPAPILKRMIEMGDRDFAEEFIITSMGEEKDIVQLVGEDYAKKVVENISNAIPSSQVVFKNMMENRNMVKRITPIYYPIFDTVLARVKYHKEDAWLWGILTDMIDLRFTIPKYIWNSLDDNWKRELKNHYDDSMKGDILYKGYKLHESFKQYFKGKHIC